MGRVLPRSSSLHTLGSLSLLLPLPFLAACSSATGETAPNGQGPSNIHHVVVVIQENHTFDNYLGSYCTAPPGSSPACTSGPACCEAAPATEPSGQSPIVLDDAANAAYDPNHTQACELAEADGGKMDQYVAGAGSACSDPRNFAIAPAPSNDAALYQQYAATYAIADRYFQPVSGQSSSNDMYLAVAQYVFTDNDDKPNAAGMQCALGGGEVKSFTGVTTIADLLLAAGNRFAFYAGGYAAVKGQAQCPSPPPDCPFGVSFYPCLFDPSDVPFQYYAQFADNPDTMKDYDDLATDIDGGQLPEVAFVKGIGYKTEHPGYGTTISAGTTFVQGVVDKVLSSAYANDTLILVTWDEGGGYFDHIAPPAPSQFDGQPYGTRVPLIAIGPFVKTGSVSHVEMEHSSIVKFLEYNFLHATGQLQARDLLVANIGSLLDPVKTGVAIPDF